MTIGKILTIGLVLLALALVWAIVQLKPADGGPAMLEAFNQILPILVGAGAGSIAGYASGKKPAEEATREIANLRSALTAKDLL